jgi:hypothetical protein
MSDEKSIAIGVQRSPSYPQYGLRRAVEMAKSIYMGAHRAEISNEAVVSLAGFKSISGPSSAAIGALKQFGLLEGRDPKLRITSLALEILESLNDAERKRALRSAATMPSPFADLMKEFGYRRPAESVLRSMAVRRYNFSGSGADRFVTAYMDTLDFLMAEGAASDEVDVVLEESEAVTEQPKRITDRTTVAAYDVLPEAPSAGEKFEFRLSSEARAVVVIHGRVTQQAIEKLASVLSLVKDTYPMEEDD